jgi:hypothetical protein
MILSRHNPNPEEFALDMLLFIRGQNPCHNPTGLRDSLAKLYVENTDSARQLAPKDKAIDLTTSLSDGEIPHLNMIQPKES